MYLFGFNHIFGQIYFCYQHRYTSRYRFKANASYGTYVIADGNVHIKNSLAYPTNNNRADAYLCDCLKLMTMTFLIDNCLACHLVLSKVAFSCWRIRIFCKNKKSKHGYWYSSVTCIKKHDHQLSLGTLRRAPVLQYIKRINLKKKSRLKFL